MEYLSFLSCCCKKDDTSNTIKISCNLNCFKNKTYQINIVDQEDVEKVMKLIAFSGPSSRRSWTCPKTWRKSNNLKINLKISFLLPNQLLYLHEILLSSWSISHI